MVATILVALSPRRRALIARTFAQSRHFVPRGAVDRDARDREAHERWDDDGGAKNGGNDAIIR